MADYNGWANWETWNVELWINNEEPIYRMKQTVLRGWRDITADRVEAHVKMWMPIGTPDFDDPSDYDKVDWSEIAEAWTNEALEYA